MNGEYFATKVVNMKILGTDDCGLVMQYLLNHKPNKNLKYSAQRRAIEFAEFEFDVFRDGNHIKNHGQTLSVMPSNSTKTMAPGPSLSSMYGGGQKRLYGYSKAFNSGIHRFSVQCVVVGDSQKDAVGILTEVGPCKEDHIFFNDKRVPKSFVWAQYGSFFKVVRTSCNEIVQNIQKWKTGDVIALEVDCNQWMARCFMNDCLVAEGAIANEKKYYFAVGIRSTTAQYKVIDYQVTL